MNEYCAIVRRVLGESEPEEAFIYDPPIAVATVENGIKRRQAQMIVRQVQPHHVSVINSAINERFEVETCGVPQNIVATLGEAMKGIWLQQHCFEIIADVLASSTRVKEASLTSQGSIGENLPVTMIAREPSQSCGGAIVEKAAELNMFAQPKKRSRVSRVTQGNVALVSTSVAQLHGEEHFTSDALSLKCVVLHYPSELRWVKTEDKKTRQAVDVAVLNVLVADGTGPIHLELWRNAAETTWKDLEEWSCLNSETLCVEVQHFWANPLTEERQPSIPAARKLISNIRTKIVRLESTTAVSAAQLAASLYSTDFSVLESKPPYRVSISGYVSSVDVERSSESGTPMKSFRLQNDVGRYVHCTVLGRHVDNSAIMAGNCVVVYFAKAAAGRGGNPGQLWLYEDSHVVFLSKRAALPPARMLLELRT